MRRESVLVIGYGNPARGDDGLGPALAERIEALGLPDVAVEADYQLSIEHAALAAEHDVVVFADAATDSAEPFYFRPVAARPVEGCSSHFATPGQVLHLARSCFGREPAGFVLGMRAASLGRFEEGLSGDARAALDAATDHLVRFVANRRGAGVPPPPQEGADARPTEASALHR